MTDKELIRQEIERRIKNLEFSLENNCVEKHSKLDILGNITTLESLLQFIDSLPEEPASEDLEEEFYRFIDEEEGIPKMCNTRECIAWGVDIASHFAEWQEKKSMQEFMEKAEEFFNAMYDTMGKPALGKKTIEQFKNYMQDERLL